MKNFNWALVLSLLTLPITLFCNNGNFSIQVSSSTTTGGTLPSEFTNLGNTGIYFNVFVNPLAYYPDEGMPQSISLPNIGEPLFVIIESYGEVLSYMSLYERQFEKIDLNPDVRKTCFAYMHSAYLDFNNSGFCIGGTELAITPDDQAIILGEATLRIVAGNSLFNPTSFYEPQHPLNRGLLGMNFDEVETCVSYQDSGLDFHQLVLCAYDSDRKERHNFLSGNNNYTVPTAKADIVEFSSIEAKRVVQSSVFPNPFQNRITISLPDANTEKVITIHSSNGMLIRKVLISDKKEYSIITENWVSGVYFVQIRLKESVTSFKIVKN